MGIPFDPAKAWDERKQQFKRPDNQDYKHHAVCSGGQEWAVDICRGRRCADNLIVRCQSFVFSLKCPKARLSGRRPACRC
jgi:hypothetical protein